MSNGVEESYIFWIIIFQLFLKIFKKHFVSSERGTKQFCLAGYNHWEEKQFAGLP